MGLFLQNVRGFLQALFREMGQSQKLLQQIYHMRIYLKVPQILVASRKMELQLAGLQ